MSYLLATLLTLIVIIQVNANVLIVRTNPGLKKPRTLSAEERALLEKPPQIDFKPRGILRQDELCSSNKFEMSSRIVGGSETTRGTITYQCFLDIDSTYICGGSLISSQWVLTAAHCAINRTNFRVTLGAQDNSVFEAGRITVDTIVKIIHEAYNNDYIYNDIALVKLPLVLSAPTTPIAYWSVIRLPRRSQAYTTFAGLLGLASGWGKTSDSATSNPSIMHSVQMPIITNTACAVYYSSDIILPSNICTNTTGGTKSICQGDSGGPLVVKDTDNISTIVGISSFVSSLGCQSGGPAAFTRVSSYLGWISSKTGIAIMP